MSSRVDGKTRIYGIMGKPVSHSLSPAMHNRAFEELGLNNIYVPFEVENVELALKGFRALGVHGVSVTVPHKEEVIHYLDEIDPVAEKIGAVNTLIINDNNIKGFNTDWLGANRALEGSMELDGSRVLILGAGGSARAIGFGLVEAGAAVVISSRTPARGRGLAADLDCKWRPLSEAREIKADALVNATTVGMGSDSDQIPVAASVLGSFPVVMDIVYSPIETRLLKEAAGVGCKVINGLEMLLFQGVAQFELWTGRAAPAEIMRMVLVEKMSGWREIE